MFLTHSRNLDFFTIIMKISLNSIGYLFDEIAIKK